MEDVRRQWRKCTVHVPTIPRPVCVYNLPQSFFTIYRNLFSRLAYDESQWSHFSQEDFPGFGDHKSMWTKSESGPEVRAFYAGWLSFSTSKDFSWADKWDLSDAPDRRVRRYVLIDIPTCLPSRPDPVTGLWKRKIEKLGKTHAGSTTIPSG